VQARVQVDKDQTLALLGREGLPPPAHRFPLSPERGVRRCRSAFDPIDYLPTKATLLSFRPHADMSPLIDNLQRFTVIGFVEDLEHFADDIAARFGRRPAILHVNKNPAPLRRPEKWETDTAIRPRPPA
jgi:hypothetical protein